MFNIIRDIIKIRKIRRIIMKYNDIQESLGQHIGEKVFIVHTKKKV